MIHPNSFVLLQLLYYTCSNGQKYENFLGYLKIIHQNELSSFRADPPKPTSKLPFWANLTVHCNGSHINQQGGILKSEKLNMLSLQTCQTTRLLTSEGHFWKKKQYEILLSISGHTVDGC